MCKAVDEYGNEREAKGRQEGMLNTVKNIMFNLNVNVNEAMRIAGIKEEDKEFLMIVL